jgi:hypothetical protein
MKPFKPNRMLWLFIIAGATSFLAFLSAYIQYKENINNKDEQLKQANELIAQQKETLNYLTGGDTLPRIIASPGAMKSYNNSEVQLEIYNQSRYPQHDVDVFITDNFKYQVLTKDYPKNLPLSENEPLFDKVASETGIKRHFDRIEAGATRLLYVTNLPIELKEGFFLVNIKRGIDKQNVRVTYKHWSGKGDWDLVEQDELYKNIGKQVK